MRLKFLSLFFVLILFVGVVCAQDAIIMRDPETNEQLGFDPSDPLARAAAMRAEKGNVYPTDFVDKVMTDNYAVKRAANLAKGGGRILDNPHLTTANKWELSIGWTIDAGLAYASALAPLVQWEMATSAAMKSGGATVASGIGPREIFSPVRSEIFTGGIKGGRPLILGSSFSDDFGNSLFLGSRGSSDAKLMDPDRLQKMIKNLEGKGYRVKLGQEEWLRARGYDATYVPDELTFYFKTQPRKIEVIEELMHYHQHRTGRLSDLVYQYGMDQVDAATHEKIYRKILKKKKIFLRPPNEGQMRVKEYLYGKSLTPDDIRDYNAAMLDIQVDPPMPIRLHPKFRGP